MTYVLIFAGGTGQRMNSRDVPKQFLEIGGKPIIIWTVEHFSNHKAIDSIVIVCLEPWIPTLESYLEKFNVGKIASILPGGMTGYQSIHRGLEKIHETAAPDDLVLICDGVRPILTPKLISDCIVETKRFGSAVPVTPSKDSAFYSEDGIICSRNLSRGFIYITQAPQGYLFQTIWDAHTKAEEMHLDPISSGDLMIDLGGSVHIFPGIDGNIKITTPDDLLAAEAIIHYGTN